MSILQKFKSSAFARNVAKLASGTAFAQAISILTAPILYRMYDRVDYGTLGLYMAITGVLAPLMNGQFYHGVLLLNDDTEAHDLARKLMKLNLILGCIILALTIPSVNVLAQPLNNSAVEPWLWFISVIRHWGRVEVLKPGPIGKKDYSILVSFVMATAIITPTISISLAYITEDATGLFVGLFTGQLIPWFLLESYYIHKTQDYSPVTKHTYRAALTPHVNFLKFTLPADFLNRLIQQLPVFILSTLAGPAMVGVFNLCVRMLGLPIQLISTSVSEVFRQQAAINYKDNGNCRSLVVKTAKVLSGMITPALVLILFFGPQLFGIAFGQEWRQAGVFAQILALPFSLRFIVSPLSYMFMIAERQKLDLQLHILSLILCVACMVGGRQVHAEYGMVIGYGLTMTIIYLAYGRVSLNLARGHGAK